MPGLLYTMLLEKVFKRNIPVVTKKKLTCLQEGDVHSIEKNSHDKLKYPPGHHLSGDARVLYNLGRFHTVDEVVAMSWTMHYNAALTVHRWKKEGKPGGGGGGGSVVNGAQFSHLNPVFTPED